MARQTLRRAVLVGGTRIPFARSNTAYAELTNQDMLTRTLEALTERFALASEKIDEANAGAVITHSKDWNLAREAVLGTSLSPLTPAYTIQQACGTSLEGTLLLANKIATGAIDCGIAAGTDTTSDAPIVFPRSFARRVIRLQNAKTLGERLRLLAGFRPRDFKPVAPGTAEPRTHLSMGGHTERMAKEWQIGRREQDELAVASHHKAARAYEEGFFDDLVVPCEGLTRDNNLRPDTSVEKIAKLPTSFDKGPEATLSPANSTPLTDGAAAVLVASEDWAKARGLPIQAYLTHSRTAAVDFVAGEGLLMAPTVAISEMLDRAGLRLQDFDFYEIHEAFAAQVLCTLRAFESDTYCRERLGRDGPLGPIDPDRINVTGSSIALGHPFAATGARIVATLGKLLERAGSGRGLMSVCTAGGMGVTAIMERP